MALVDALVAEGFEVLEAADGDTGLELALREGPDAVLLDLMLPRRDGFSVLRAIREDRLTAPVLILWAVVREIRALATVAWQTSHGAKAADVMSKAGIWPKRQSWARSALARHRLPDLHRLLRQAASAERIIKGAAPGNSWPALTDLIGRFAASGRSVRGEAA